VRAVAFAPDGSTLASGGGDHTVRVWDTASGAPIATLTSFAAGGWAVLLPDGSYTLVGESGRDLWWAVKLCRSTPGELDGVDPATRRRAPTTFSVTRI
jgi:WD40 repeat protein